VATLRIRDDLGRDLLFARAPERVVSLVPSDTHSLFALGLGDRVVGRTRYCDAPAAAAAVPVVGGTKDVDVEAVLDARPELVIANQEENGRAALERLALQVPTLVSLPRRVADGIAHLARLARIFRIERVPEVAELIRRGYHGLRAAEAAVKDVQPLPVFVPIWMDPLMTFNAETFGSDVLAQAGAGNVFGDRSRLYPLTADLGKAAAQDPGGRDTRYPRVTLEEALVRAPRVVLLPDEPHAFTEADAAAIAAALPAARVVPVSGKDLFWYGAWTVDALPRVAALVEKLRWELFHAAAPC
jgi:ABC-type Fe3+-hydroxamate transport system substrate-binding protein